MKLRDANVNRGRCDSCGGPDAAPVNCCVLFLCPGCTAMHEQHCGYGKLDEPRKAAAAPAAASEKQTA